MKVTLKDALKLIRETQEAARGYGYHICLGGGVLNKGESDKDLDLYFLPLIGEDIQEDKLIEALTIGWANNGDVVDRAISGGDHEGPYSRKLRFHPSKLSPIPGVTEVFIMKV